MTYGKLSGTDSSIISAQPGVKKILDADELRKIVQKKNPIVLKPDQNNPANNEVDPAKIPEVVYVPRGIIADDSGDAFIAYFGCSVCRRYKRVAIVRKDLITGEILYTVDNDSIRNLAVIDRTIIFSPYNNYNIYEVLKSDLTLLRVFQRQECNMACWLPVYIFKDIHESRIYISTDYQPAIISFDLNTGNLLKLIDFNKSGDLGVGEGEKKGGGAVETIVQSQKTRKLYFFGVPGEYQIFEMDPDTMKITKKLKLPGIDESASALIIDNHSDKIYCQSMFFDIIYRIDIQKFKIDREYEGDNNARRLCLDINRNVIYIQGYVSDNLTALDLESGEHMWRIKSGIRGHGIDLKKDILWIHSMAGAFKIDLNTVWRNKGYAGTRFDLSGKEEGSLPAGRTAEK